MAEEKPLNHDGEAVQTTGGSNTTPSVKSYRRITIYAAIIVLIFASWIEVIDRKTEAHIDQTLVTALATFASARAVNMATSVMKSAEVELSFLAGMSLDFGAIADPIDDMIEDFSTVMKFASASLVLQKIIIEIVSSTAFKILLTIGGLLFIGILHLGPTSLSNTFFKVFLTVGLVRFLLIFVLAASAFADNAFLEKQTNVEAEKLNQQSGEIQSALSGAQLSNEEKAALESERGAANKSKRESLAELKALSAQFEDAQGELASAQENLESVSEKRSTLDSINFMKDDPVHDKAKAARDEAAATVERVAEEMDLLAEKIEHHDARVEDIQAIIEGRDGSFANSMTKKMSSIKDSLSFDNISQAAENFVDTTIRLMSLFVLKAIILPLLFLYIGIKAFQAIWRVNLAEFAQQEYAEGRQVLADKRRPKSDKMDPGD